MRNEPGCHRLPSYDSSPPTKESTTSPEKSCRIMLEGNHLRVRTVKQIPYFFVATMTTPEVWIWEGCVTRSGTKSRVHQGDDHDGTTNQGTSLGRGGGSGRDVNASRELRRIDQIFFYGQRVVSSKTLRITCFY